MANFLSVLEGYQKQGVRIAHICTENDINGNPRRCYFDLKDGTFYDEGYAGFYAVPEHLRKDASEAEYNYRINLKPRQYSAFIKTTETVKNILS